MHVRRRACYSSELGIHLPCEMMFCFHGGLYEKHKASPLPPLALFEGHYIHFLSHVKLMGKSIIVITYFSNALALKPFYPTL
jgi:hypothetical protein